jgi:hypothetical protein
MKNSFELPYQKIREVLMKRSALLLALLSITLLAGCRTVAVIPVGTHSTVTHSQHVYPPRHPGHGHRHHYYGHDLEYDTDFGAYMVLGYDGIYFYNDVYLRFYAGGWQITSSLNGTWYDAEHRHVPDRLWNHRRYNRHHRNSPPPHAPAHGHRYRHDHGVDLVFDSGVGAYIVLGFDDLFFFNNNYMRFYDGNWHHADRHDGRWRRANDRHVPHKLRKARRHNKEGLFKKIKGQYKKEHRESRESYRRHDDRRKYKKHDKKDKYDRDNRHDRDSRHKKDSRHDKHKDKKGGLFSKTKKQHEQENRKRKRDDDEENNDRSDRDRDRDDSYYRR